MRMRAVLQYVRGVTDEVIFKHACIKTFSKVPKMLIQISPSVKYNILPYYTRMYKTECEGGLSYTGRTCILVLFNNV